MSRDANKPGGSNDRPGDPRAAEIFRLEKEAEDMSARLYAESQEGLDNRCEACGALGSLEEQADGEVRCVDCDVVVAQRSKLGGYGRK